MIEFSSTQITPNFVKCYIVTPFATHFCSLPVNSRDILVNLLVTLIILCVDPATSKLY